VDLHKLASLMVRDHTISAKRFQQLAGDSYALAATWKQVLAGECPTVLQSDHREDGVLGAPAVKSDTPAEEQGSWAFVDMKGETVL